MHPAAVSTYPPRLHRPRRGPMCVSAKRTAASESATVTVQGPGAPLLAYRAARTPVLTTRTNRLPRKATPGPVGVQVAGLDKGWAQRHGVEPEPTEEVFEEDGAMGGASPTSVTTVPAAPERPGAPR